MIKGVNKTIIEINEYDSKMFEKAILFLKPNAQNYTTIGLKSEAKKYLKGLEENTKTITDTRKKRRRKVIKNRIILGVIFLCILTGSAILLGINI